MQPVLPSVLSHADAAALLERAAPALRQAAGSKVLARTCLVAPSFLDSVQAVLLEEARRAAEEAHVKQRKAAAAGARAGARGVGGMRAGHPLGSVALCCCGVGGGRQGLRS